VGLVCALAIRQTINSLEIMEKVNFNNHSKVNESVETTKVGNGVKSTKKRREESPYLKIRSKAVNIFRTQLDKSVGTKRLAVERAISKIADLDYARGRFLSEFKQNVDLLLDSKRFERDCLQHNLTPFNAATHIVFDGSSKIELVLKNGVYPTYSTQLLELTEPIYT
jgi:hypothetical protein